MRTSFLESVAAVGASLTSLPHTFLMRRQKARLAPLLIEGRKILDDHGFNTVHIVRSYVPNKGRIIVGLEGSITKDREREFSSVVNDLNELLKKEDLYYWCGSSYKQGSNIVEIEPSTYE